MSIQYYRFTFIVEGKDLNGNLVIREQEFIHATEEQARRELIHTLNSLHRFFPRKITLQRINEWEPSPFFFD
jgi:hypothetical protein